MANPKERAIALLAGNGAGASICGARMTEILTTLEQRSGELFQASAGALAGAIMLFGMGAVSAYFFLATIGEPELRWLEKPYWWERSAIACLLIGVVSAIALGVGISLAPPVPTS